METLYKWILGFMLVAIFLEKSLSESCGLNSSKQCPDITLSTSGTVCYSAVKMSEWIATVNCSGNTTNHTCSASGKSWVPPVNCTDSSSTPNDNSTATTAIINGTPTNNDNTNNTNATTTKTTKSTTTTTKIINPNTTTTKTSNINTTNDLTTSNGDSMKAVVHQKKADGNVALYVSVPIVIVVLVAALILFLIWRRKNRDTEKKQNGFAFHNESYRRHDGTNSNNAPIPLSDRSSTAEDNQYSVIPADTVNPVSENDESTYNTIDLPEGVRDNYCHVTTKTTVPNDNTYSHMPDNSSLPITDNTYSHIGNSATGSTMFQKKPTDGSADTYNTLQTLPNNRVGLHTKPRKTDIENGDIDAEYNHLANTLKRPAEAEEEKNADTYSHICQSAKPNREYAEQEKKTNVLNQQSKADLKNNEYESASGVSSPYLEFKVEDQTDGNASTKQFKILEHPSNETNNYEEAHTHQYFVLEKEDRMAV